MVSDITEYCVSSASTIRQVIACIERNSGGTALVVDPERRLQDVITDGDVRRAILSGLSLDESINVLRSRRAHSAYPEPVTALIGTESEELLRLMQERAVRQIPLVDESRRVTKLVFLRDLLPDETWPLQAVVMAGGFGNRMRPLTEKMPKPMLPVSDKPLLELILQQLREAGVRRVNVTTHYKSEVIANHFGDGRNFGVEINYIQEDQPLGTAGALNFVDKSEGPLLIMNGDIITQVDFRAMVDFHRDNRADMTVGVRLYELSVPYGVMETEGIDITGISEKPVLKHFINAGIYLLDQSMRRHIPTGQPFDMPDLIKGLIAEGHRVVSFPIHEYWLDIGHHADYEKALADAKEGKIAS